MADQDLRTVPLLPLRDMVVFPHQVVPLFVGREKSLSALQDALSSESHEILFCAQREGVTEEPGPKDIHEVGCLGTVLQRLHLPDGTVKVLVEGRQRAQIRRYVRTESCFHVDIALLEEDSSEPVASVLMREVAESFESYVKLNKRAAPEILGAIASIEEPGQLADTILGHLSVKAPEKQALLELTATSDRMARLFELLKEENEILKVERRIRSKVKRRAERVEQQRFVNEQVQNLQREPGGPPDEFKSEMDEFTKRAADKDLPEEVRTRIDKELRKLRLMAPMSAEAAVVRTYVDWLLCLPWGDASDQQIDVLDAQRILDEEHHGLGPVKERILEFLSVQSLAPQVRGPILCLVGPPGVGKTSLARSIARATGRTYVRLALGGIRDEAEIRGHRRTYIGAMPGKIIQSMRKAGVDNPLFLLDEVDKMSSDFRGDPAAAMLEVLDPEQNSSFADHYLEVDYDLSSVMFVATANYLQNIPPPLLDRLELVQLGGYTETEKVAIAQNHLVPRQQKNNGLQDVALKVPESSLRSIIQNYTREAGVRALDRELATICRKVAREYVSDRSNHKHRITAGRLTRYLGPPRFRHGRAEQSDEVGLVAGLAVTSHGGDLLLTEVSIVSGRGKLVLTGKLGDVMQESAQAALSYLRSRAISLGIEPDFHSRADIHVHLPEGAIPKDGPSAGITICTALASALLRVSVRRDVAMTGEITLRGRVLPIGGLREKILAAHRAGVTKVVIPKDNIRDLKDVPRKTLRDIKVVPVEHMDEVLREALRWEQPGGFLAGSSEVVDWRLPVGTQVDERAAPPGGDAPPRGGPTESDKGPLRAPETIRHARKP